jgi:Na+/phosphate symporter
MTTEDLEQIGKLLDASVEQIKKNMATKSDLETNNRVLGTIFKIELTSTSQEIISVVKAGFQETARQLKRIEQKHDKKLEDYEERIERLKHDSPAIPHKN